MAAAGGQAGEPPDGGRGIRPLVALEGPRAAQAREVRAVLAIARRDGWRVVRGWAAPLGRERIVCTGGVRSADDGRRALLAGVAGAGLVVTLETDRETIDVFLDDLRRLGPVHHKVLDASATMSRVARPIVVVEGPADALTRAVLELARAGWRIRTGFEPPPPGRRPRDGTRDVRVGAVRTAEDAAAAMLAVLDGDGVVVHASAPPEVLDRLLDDLRHIGPVDHRRVASAPAPVLGAEARGLLVLLAAGRTLADAAGTLGLSRRTADRRLAEARMALRVGRTVEAVAAARRLGWLE